jgi:sugar phosphate isomerase/epimerase
MRLASADFSWPGLRPEFVLDLIKELGLEGVSMAFIDGYSARQPREVAAEAEAWGIRIARDLEHRNLDAADVFLIPSSDLAGMSVNHPDPAERASGEELFTAFLCFARAVGATGMTILPGMVFDGEIWDDALERAAEALRRRLDQAQVEGLRLSVEPHIVTTRPYLGSLIDTPAKVAELLDKVPGLELTLDYGHFNVQGIPDRDVEPLLESARHFHMRGGAPGLVQTRFEDNTIDFGRVLEVMKRVGYDGWVEIEYVHDSRPGCSSCDNIQEVQKFRDYVSSQMTGRPAGAQ